MRNRLGRPAGRQSQSPRQGMLHAPFLLLALHSPLPCPILRSPLCLTPLHFEIVCLLRVIPEPSNSPNSFTVVDAFLTLKTIVFSEIILVPLLVCKLPQSRSLCWLFLFLHLPRDVGPELRKPRAMHGSYLPLCLCVTLPCRMLTGVDLTLVRWTHLTFSVAGHSKSRESMCLRDKGLITF